MDCPNDGTTLQMTDRQGIEIDYCPDCRGVWLDRGELDKIVERSASWAGGDGRRDNERRDQPKAEKPKKSKSKSFFETIMESVGEG
jgi:Zn-finger nucleic acid-binding protein